MHGVALGLLILLILIALETLVMSWLVGSAPTESYVFLFRNSTFIKIIWASNAWETLKLLTTGEAVFIVEHRDAANGLQIWGLYFFMIHLLAQCAVACLAGIGWVAGFFRRLDRALMLYVSGALLLIFATSYVRLASCCTTGPGWLVDVWLLSLVFDPTPSMLDWQGVYEWAEKLFMPVQIALALSGIYLLFHGWEQGRRSASRV